MASEGQTILVVEDNAITREGLGAILREAGYTVVLTAHGGEALAYLHGNPSPDLILLDMLMPVLDGWHFLNELKRPPSASVVPILITTSTVLSREWALSHGCCGFLRKPIEPESLLAEIRRCLAGRSEP